METNKNKCYDIIIFIFCMFTWMYYLKILLIKSKKCNFIQNGPPLHLITASNLLRIPSDAAHSCSCGISFILDVVSTLSHQQCDELFYRPCF